MSSSHPTTRRSSRPEGFEPRQVQDEDREAHAHRPLGTDNADGFAFRGGFATNGQTPAALGPVRFAFGGALRRVIDGSEFTKSGDTFKFSSKQGTTSFTITIDFLRETVTVTGKKVELGAVAGSSADFVFDAGANSGTIRNTVRLGASGVKRYYQRGFGPSRRDRPDIALVRSRRGRRGPLPTENRLVGFFRASECPERPGCVPGS